MKLPNAELAFVEREKIAGYPLDPSHMNGAGKCRFFSGHGFRMEEWPTLAAALVAHGRRHDVARRSETPFGPRFEVQGELESPDGSRPQIRTVWQLDDGEIAPRLITAYPLSTSR